MEGERVGIPLVIGGEDVFTDETFEAVMPHRKSHVLGDVAKGGPEHVEQAIAAARAAHDDWSRTPWHERAAVFLRAAELLAGPWRQTLNAATMLDQSKTAHQAEIDAACELIDFWRFNVGFLARIYAEQPYSPTGTWNRWSTGPWRGSSSRSARSTSRRSAGTSRRRLRSWATRSSGSPPRPQRSPRTTSCGSSRPPACRTA